MPLPKVTPAKLSIDGAQLGTHRDGQVLAVRPDGRVLFYDRDGDTKFDWVAGEKVDLGSR